MKELKNCTLAEALGYLKRGYTIRHGSWPQNNSIWYSHEQAHVFVGHLQAKKVVSMATFLCMTERFHDTDWCAWIPCRNFMWALNQVNLGWNVRRRAWNCCHVWRGVKPSSMNVQLSRDDMNATDWELAR